MSIKECLIHNAGVVSRELPDNCGIRCTESNQGDSINVEFHMVMPDGSWRWHDRWFDYVDGDITREDFRRAMCYMDGAVDMMSLCVPDTVQIR